MTETAKTVEEKKVKSHFYRLVRDYDDGTRVHPRGSILEFEEGKQPRKSILVPKKEVKELSKAEKAAAAAREEASRNALKDEIREEVQGEMDELRAELEALRAEAAELVSAENKIAAADTLSGDTGGTPAAAKQKATTN